MISIAAELVGMHPQTLRIYEQKGLVRPQRTAGNTRLYSDDDVERLRLIQRLTGEIGLNLRRREGPAARGRAVRCTGGSTGWSLRREAIDQVTAVQARTRRLSAAATARASERPVTRTDLSGARHRHRSGTKA